MFEYPALQNHTFDDGQEIGEMFEWPAVQNYTFDDGQEIGEMFECPAVQNYTFDDEQESTNAVQLFNQCLATEMKFLQAAGADFLRMGPALTISNSGAEVLHKVEDLRRRTQATSEDTRKLEQEQEAFALQYHECTKVNAHLQQKMNNLAPAPLDQQALQLYIKRKEMLEVDLNRRVAALMELRIKITEKFKQTYQLLAQLQSQIIDDELIRWKRDQQLAGNGVPFTNNLDQIQDWCESLAEIIWYNRQQIKEVERLKQQLALDPPGVVDVLPQILAEITQLLSSLVTSTFIIEKQPPQVMKTNTKFKATIRLLVGGKLNVHMSPPQVKVTIISESQANLLLKNDIKGGDSSGEILNNTGTMEYQQTTRQLSVSFRNMQLKKIKRSEKKGAEYVMDEKFSLFFQSQFSVGGGELMFQVWTLSLPVVVIVHGNQEPHAWATVTWDNAFSEPGRYPFQVPDKVPWTKMKETLSQKFKWATGRGLTDYHLHFLAEKAFRGNFNEPNSSMLSWAQFCKEPITERNFTFWEWFFAIMKLTREHLKGPWVDGAIMGFVQKNQAEEMLSTCQAGTFLLRFSDSELGGITIAWVSDTSEVFSLQPFTAKDFTFRALADMIADLNQMVTLYPDTAKELLFQKYYTPYDQPKPKNTYVRRVLSLQVPGLSGPNYNNTPQHLSMSPDASRDTPSMASSFQSMLDL